MKFTFTPSSSFCICRIFFIVHLITFLQFLHLQNLLHCASQHIPAITASAESSSLCISTPSCSFCICRIFFIVCLNTFLRFLHLQNLIHCASHHLPAVYASAESSSLCISTPSCSFCICGIFFIVHLSTFLKFLHPQNLLHCASEHLLAVFVSAESSSVCISTHFTQLLLRRSLNHPTLEVNSNIHCGGFLNFVVSSYPHSVMTAELMNQGQCMFFSFAAKYLHQTLPKILSATL